MRAAPSATSALAFTPPVARDVGELGLERESRGPVAYAGYESQVFSQTVVYQDDNQMFQQNGRSGFSGDYSRFQRRAVTSSVTVRTR